jgi:hypothetical protein
LKKSIFPTMSVRVSKPSEKGKALQEERESKVKAQRPLPPAKRKRKHEENVAQEPAAAAVAIVPAPVTERTAPAPPPSVVATHSIHAAAAASVASSSAVTKKVKMQWSDEMERTLVLLRCNRANVWYLKNNYASRKIALNWQQTIVPQFNAMFPGLEHPLTMKTGQGKWECVLKKFKVKSTMRRADALEEVRRSHAALFA